MKPTWLALSLFLLVGCGALNGPLPEPRSDDPKADADGGRSDAGSEVDGGPGADPDGGLLDVLPPDVVPPEDDAGLPGDVDAGAAEDAGLPDDVDAGISEDAGALDAGPDAGTSEDAGPSLCGCETTIGVCDATCACDPDCGNPPPPPPPCECETTIGVCDANCLCDPDCGNPPPPPPPCECETTIGVCDANCLCDPDCGNPPPPPPPCECETAPGVCDPSCACDPDCGGDPGMCPMTAAASGEHVPDCSHPACATHYLCGGTEDCTKDQDVDQDGAFSCNDMDCYYEPECNTCDCDATAGACDASCACDPDCYDCYDIHLIGNYDNVNKTWGLTEGQEGCYVEWDDNSRTTTTTRRIVACENGQLVTREDCGLYQGDAVCAPDGTRDDALHCMPASGVDACTFFGLRRGERRCFTDERTGDRYLMECWSAIEPEVLEAQEPHAVAAVTGGAGLMRIHNDFTDGTHYLAFTDCYAPDENSMGIEGVCIDDPMTRMPRCVASPTSPRPDIYEAISAFVPDLPDAPGYTVYPENRFPETQNLVTCMNPTPGNRVPYVQLDTLGQIYTDYDMALVLDELELRHANQLKYLAYSSFSKFEQRPGQYWYDASYQYAYWRWAFTDDDGNRLEVIPEGCWDADGDGYSNLVDNCPLVANPDQADGNDDHVGDACAPDLPRSNDYDEDGIGNSEDNCPLVYNPRELNANGALKQPDRDNDAIGDACDVVCDGDGNCVPECDASGENCAPTECRELIKSSDTIARIAADGDPRPTGDAMGWWADICQPKMRILLKRLVELWMDLGVDGVTFDEASTGGCFNDDNVQGFRNLILEIRSDPNHEMHLGYLRARDEVALSGYGGPDLDDPAFDVGAYRRAVSDMTWSEGVMSRLWSLFQERVTDEFIAELVAHAEAYRLARYPDRDPFLFFFNNTDGVRWNHHKSIAGSETFIAPRHPVSGASYGFDDEGPAWPVLTLEHLYDQHLGTGKRFWNWTLPHVYGDDRNALYVAEALANGGIVQAGGCDLEYLAPYSGYTGPNYRKRAEQQEILQFVSDHFEWLSLERAPREVAVYWPQGVFECREGQGLYQAQVLYQALRSLHWSVEILSGGPFTLPLSPDSPANPPRLEELLDDAGQPRHRFVVIPGFRAISAAEERVFEAYVEAGGVMVVLPEVGTVDPFCELRQSVGLPDWSARWNLTPNERGGYFLVLSGQLLNDPAVDPFIANLPSGTRDPVHVNIPTKEEVKAMGLYQALGYLRWPNHAVSLDDDSAQYLVDVPGLRGHLHDWLAAQLAPIGAPSFGTELPPTVHVAEYEKPDGAGAALPVWHLVNYAMTTETVSPYYHQTGAGMWETYTVEVGRTVPLQRQSLTVPIPEALRCVGGEVVVRSNGQGSPAPEQVTPFAPGVSAVAIELDMFQWAIVTVRGAACSDDTDCGGGTCALGTCGATCP